MLKENFKVAVPEFPDRKTSITAYGAVKMYMMTIQEE